MRIKNEVMNRSFEIKIRQYKILVDLKYSFSFKMVTHGTTWNYNGTKSVKVVHVGYLSLYIIYDFIKL